MISWLNWYNWWTIWMLIWTHLSWEDDANRFSINSWPLNLSKLLSSEYYNFDLLRSDTACRRSWSWLEFFFLFLIFSRGNIPWGQAQILNKINCSFFVWCCFIDILIILTYYTFYFVFYLKKKKEMKQEG